jgi:hypothetical protein
MPSTDAQDRIVKQLGDRYHRMQCLPQEDGSLKILADRAGVGSVLWRRTVLVDVNGVVLSDEEIDIDSYEDF